MIMDEKNSLSLNLSWPDKHFFFVEECGKMGPASNFSPKIVGGSEAAAHQFPWQVGIFMDGKNFCGGSIICKFEEYHKLATILYT